MWKTILIRIPLGVLALVALAWLLLPWPVLLRWGDVESTAVMRDRVRSAEEELRVRHEWVPLERVSPSLRRAVVAAEDGRFYRHGGVDWRAVAEELRWTGDDDFSLLDPADLRAAREAVDYYREHRGEVRGRSTITQQLAKNLYYDTDRSLVRKFQEFFVAHRLEWFLGKDRILELYLNTAEWGPGIFGAEAAARHYYDRPAADLTAVQAASLAATLPHPLSANPARNAGRLTRRRDLILSWMRETRGAPEREVPEPPRIPRPEELMPDLSVPEATEPSDAEPPPEEPSDEPPSGEPTDTTPVPPEDTTSVPRGDAPPATPADTGGAPLRPEGT